MYVNKYSVMLELFRHPEDRQQGSGIQKIVYVNKYSVMYVNKVVKGNIASATACGDPQNYVSWDGIHATEAANNIIASAVMSGAYSYPPSGLSKLCQP